MKFCDVCDNMLYIKLEDADNKLIHYCKNCGFNLKSDGEDSTNKMMCVFSSADGHADVADYKQFMTTSIKHDPTLPRVNHVRCPNAECGSTDTNREVIYMKYDHANMKFLYFCTICETFWKSK